MTATASLADGGSGGAWLALAFALGIVHAFDADHVMAISVLASEEAPGRGGAPAGLRWAAGHGAVLLASGGFLLVLGWGLPEAWRAGAERGVGAVMILLGASVLLRLARSGTHLHFHHHDGLPPHAHWHTHADPTAHPPADQHKHEHVASLVGAMHGLAGSAPILALLPAAARSPLVGLGYLLLFGVGVALAMGIASGVLGGVVQRLSRAKRRRTLAGMRAASACGSISIGVWLALAA